MLNKSTQLFIGIVLIFSGLLLQANAYYAPPLPQNDTSNKITVQIIFAQRAGMFTKENGEQISRLIGDVQLKQGTNEMYCDSAYVNVANNFVEAWGNVRINQPGTTVESDYLRYQGNIKKAYLKGNVVLVNGADNLWTDELDYNLNTKIGEYRNGGTLHSEGTTLNSDNGVYNLKTKQSRFRGDVYVIDPKYEVVSEDLGYNTESKVVTFHALSSVTNPNSVLVTRSGTYDSKNGVAHFTTRSSIKNKEQYIEANKIDYNEKTGVGKATGDVLALDTIQKTTLFAEFAFIDEGKGSLLAYGKPVMKKVNGEDSLYIRADTFYSAPIPQKGDTVNGKFVKRKGSNELSSSDAPPDEDTARPRYFIGYNNVKVFADSMQAVCDSIAYSQADSTIRLMIGPVTWSRKAQITGTEIDLIVDSNAVKYLKVPGKALVVSSSGPERAKMYDQVQGDTLYGYFKNSNIEQVIVQPNASSIYYATDDNNAYIGVNQSVSREMQVFFNDQKITLIKQFQDIEQTMSPLKKVNVVNLKLDRFQWLPERRPKTIQELFD